MSSADEHSTSRLTERDVCERVTLRVDDDLLDEVEQLVEDGRYDNRSEAFRAGARLLVGGDLS